MIRAAIVGCGSISKVHADGIIKSGGKIIAVCDIIPDRAKSICDNIYTDIDTMLEKEQIDVLHICLPHHLHVPVAVKALEKDVNVLLEKPPAMNSCELDILSSAVKNSTKKLCVCFQNRFNETTDKALEYIKNKMLGKLLGARGIVTWNRDGAYYSESDWRGSKDTEGGGVLINQAIHTLDLLGVFLGKAKSVKASVNNFTHPDIDVEDNVSAVIDYENGRGVFFATTSNVTSPAAEITLFFEHGNISIDTNTLCVMPKGREREFYDYTVGSGIGKACWGESHRRVINGFYKSVLGDGDIPCSLYDCYDTINVMNKIYEV